MNGITTYLPELYMGLSSLLVHKLRSLLTMLGMIFGVGAVVAMLSIGAGAQKEVMAFIEQLGVQQPHRRSARGAGSTRRSRSAAQSRPA